MGGQVFESYTDQNELDYFPVLNLKPPIFQAEVSEIAHPTHKIIHFQNDSSNKLKRQKQIYMQLALKNS